MEIKVLKNILHANEASAASNAEFFRENGIRSANLMSSPGSGKTELVAKTIEALGGDIRFAVIEGDIRTTMDAERLAGYDVQVIQINTETFGGDCHLEASAIRSAAEQFDLGTVDFIFVENVGNLVCPAEFNLGVDRNIVLLSVTEGEDKPAKYPLMFRVCDVCLLTKVDLAGVLDYDFEKFEENLRGVNPGMKVIRLSARSGESMDEWFDYIRGI